jgi:phage baseplate assembly protein W
MARSDKYTAELVKPEFYSDFLINLDKSFLSGSLSRVTNEDSVKQSIRNLVLTNSGERFYDLLIGSKVNALLFDPMDHITENLLKDAIEETIGNYEPRARNVDVRVSGNEDTNTYSVTVVFYTINIAEQLQLDLVLKRVR